MSQAAFNKLCTVKLKYATTKNIRNSRIKYLIVVNLLSWLDNYTMVTTNYLNNDMIRSFDYNNEINFAQITFATLCQMAENPNTEESRSVQFFLSSLLES